MILTEKTNRTYAEVVTDLIRLFLKHPDHLRVTESFAGVIRNTNQPLVCVNVTAHQDDLPQVLGRGGARAQSLNQLLNLIAERRNERVNLSVNNDSSVPRRNDPVPTLLWTDDVTVQSVLENLMSEITTSPNFVGYDRSDSRTNFFIHVASKSVISNDLLRIMQQLVKGYGLVQGWKCYLTLIFLDEQ